MYAINRRGDRTLPCFTPVFTVNHFSFLCSVRTVHSHVSYRLLTALNILPAIPKSFLKHLQRHVLGIESKAFCKSMNTMFSPKSYSQDFSNTCLRQKMRSVVPLPFLYPCCSSPSKGSTLSLNLLSIILSYNLVYDLATLCLCS